MLAVPCSVHFADGAGPSVTFRAATYAPGRRQEPHRHDFTSVTLHLAGGIREWARGADVVSAGLSVSVKPVGVLHADLYGDAGARTFQVALPCGFDPGSHGWGVALGAWRWLAGGATVRAALALFQTAREDPRDADALGEGTIALFDALREADRRPAGGAAPAWLARVLDGVRDRHGEGSRVAEVAAEAGVHPVHLARVFRRHLGCTVSEYVRRVRVARAASLLGAGARISEVAHGCGFADQSHLTRQFRRETGLTPAAFRRLAAPSDVAFVQDRIARAR
jgi:AraC family transcriptional regulator